MSTRTVLPATEGSWLICIGGSLMALYNIAVLGTVVPLHDRTYDVLINLRRSGLVAVLDADHPAGDFIFCRYRWTENDVVRFQQRRVPPRTISDLPAWTPVVPITYFSSDLECTAYGPQLSLPQFRRLNASRRSSLLVWNLWGPDESSPRPFVVIPSEDLQPTLLQRTRYKDVLELNRREDHHLPTPLVSHLLKTGIPAGSYSVGKLGPLVYDGGYRIWASLAAFFSDVGLQESFQHPAGRTRDGSTYRRPLFELQQQHALEHRTATLESIRRREERRLM